MPSYAERLNAMMNPPPNAGQGVQPQPYERPVGWTPQEEQAFRTWMMNQAAASNTNPNPDDLRQAYDYRAAYRGGMQRGPDMHGSSRYKMANHPNRFVFENGRFIDTMHGQEVSPGFVAREAMPGPTAPESDMYRGILPAEPQKVGWDAANPPQEPDFSTRMMDFLRRLDSYRTNGTQGNDVAVTVRG